MTTNYLLSDELPKDAGGAKIISLIDDQSSVLDFALFRGVGVQSMGATSKNLAHMAVASHTVASKIENQSPGMMIIGAYNESPSGIGTGNAQLLRVDKEGALYTRPASGIIATNATSVQTHVVGSALLHDIHIYLSDVNAGNTVTIEDGDNYVMTFVATAASQHFSEHFATGLHFGTNIKHTLSLGGNGAASVTIGYSQY